MRGEDWRKMPVPCAAHASGLAFAQFLDVFGVLSLFRSARLLLQELAQGCLLRAAETWLRCEGARVHRGTQVRADEMHQLPERRLQPSQALHGWDNAHGLGRKFPHIFLLHIFPLPVLFDLLVLDGLLHWELDGELAVTVVHPLI